MYIDTVFYIRVCTQREVKYSCLRTKYQDFFSYTALLDLLCKKFISGQRLWFSHFTGAAELSCNTEKEGQYVVARRWPAGPVMYVLYIGQLTQQQQQPYGEQPNWISFTQHTLPSFVYSDSSFIVVPTTRITVICTGAVRQRKTNRHWPEQQFLPCEASLLCSPDRSVVGKCPALGG